MPRALRQLRRRWSVVPNSWISRSACAWTRRWRPTGRSAPRSGAEALPLPRQSPAGRQSAHTLGPAGRSRARPAGRRQGVLSPLPRGPARSAIGLSASRRDGRPTASRTVIPMTRCVCDDGSPNLGSARERPGDRRRGGAVRSAIRSIPPHVRSSAALSPSDPAEERRPKRPQALRATVLLPPARHREAAAAQSGCLQAGRSRPRNSRRRNERGRRPATGSTKRGLSHPRGRQVPAMPPSVRPVIRHEVSTMRCCRAHAKIVIRSPTAAKTRSPLIATGGTADGPRYERGGLRQWLAPEALSDRRSGPCASGRAWREAHPRRHEAVSTVQCMPTKGAQARRASSGSDAKRRRRPVGRGRSSSRFSVNPVGVALRLSASESARRGRFSRLSAIRAPSRRAKETHRSR